MIYGPVPFSVPPFTAIPVSQHAQYQGPGSPKWNRAIINVEEGRQKGGNSSKPATNPDNQ